MCFNINFRKILFFFLLISLYNCKENNINKPKVIYTKENKIAEKTNIDSTEISVKDLPIHLNDTRYIIIPEGNIRIVNDSYKNSGETISFSISNQNQNEITGFFTNVKFQHIDSIQTRYLTDKKIQIQSITHIKGKNQYLIYVLADKDTNIDGQVNYQDIKSLYISSVSGHNFKKITTEYHELIDWNIIEIQNKLYFRSVEDSNKNGAFDKNDKIHLNAIDLRKKEFIPIEIN